MFHMACPICEIYERDLKDVFRELEKRRTAQSAADMDLEIRALASAKAEIEDKYSKHQTSSH
jgi:hypothetical protein